MIIVPIKGDKIISIDGLPSKVLSYSNFNTDGPSIIVESSGQSSMFFDQIEEINGRKVTLIKNTAGYKVFSVDGFFDRKFHLPQVGEIVKSKISGIEERNYEVSRLRLHVKGKLSKGLILNCIDVESKDEIELELGQLTGIDRRLFNINSFLSLYDDYIGKGSS